MKFKTAAEILAINDVQRTPVEIPEWDCTVYVQQMSAGARDAYEAGLYQLNKTGGTAAVMRAARSTLAAASCVDADGNLLFTGAQVEALANKSSVAIDRIVKASAALNKIGEAEIEAAAKN